MTTRLYLQNAAASVSPSPPSTGPGTWTDSTDAVTDRVLGPVKAGSAATATKTETSASSHTNRALRFISDVVVSSKTITGTVTIVVGARESSTNMNAFLRATVGYLTPANAFVDMTAAAMVHGTELTTTARGWTLTATLTSTTIPVGSRLVVAIGANVTNTSSTSFNFVINYGATGATDLTDADTSVTTNPGHVTFSSDEVAALFVPTPGLTRLYLTNVADPDSTPLTFSGSEVAGSLRRLLSTTKQGSTATIDVPATGGNNQAGAWISPPVASSVTLSGYVFRCVAVNTNGSARSIFGQIFVIPGAGASGVALANSSTATFSSTTLDTSSAMKGAQFGGLPSPSLTVNAGDRLVFSPGLSAPSGAATTFQYGGTGSDVTDGSTITTEAPWIEFTEAISFVTAGPEPGRGFFATC